MTSDPNAGINFAIYDCNNMPLVEYNGNTRYDYVYDANETRVSKKVGTNTTYYTQGASGNAEMETIVGTSSTTNRYYIWGLDHIGLIQSSARYYYIKDHLGSVRMIIDKNGKVKAFDDYYPYGLVMPGRSLNMAMADERFKFNGKEQDTETGYLAFGKRYYDPLRCQFNSVDRFDTKFPSLSGYQYAACNPSRYIDKNGDSIAVLNNNSNNALTLLQQQAKSDAKRISIVNGFVMVNREGYEKGSNDFIDKIIVGVDAKEKIGLEITDKGAISIGEGINEKTNTPVLEGSVINESTTHRYVGLQAGVYPSMHGSIRHIPAGFSGYVGVSNGVDWFHANDGMLVPLSQIVGHELLENIERTVNGHNYLDAHDAANKTCFGGNSTDQLTPKMVP